ncbi:MAG: type II toxin-antitoxin system HicB family antitoxin [Catenulispora sp.]
MRTYRVVVTREGDDWLAVIPELPGAHTDARSLHTLDGYVREVIAVVEGLPEGAESRLVLDYEFHTGDETVDALIAEARHARHQAEAERRRASDLTMRALTQLVERSPGLSRRDTAALLDISHQRVQQLIGA